MRQHFSTFSSQIILEAEIDEQLVIGMGGVVSPGLMFHVRLDFRSPFEHPGRGLRLDELRCQLALEQGYVGPPVSVSPHLIVSADTPKLPNQLVHIVVPLDQTKLAQFERVRQGRDMAMRLDFEAFITELAEVGRTKATYPEIAWGILRTQRYTAQMPVTVPRSSWLEKVVPQTGHGNAHLIELPLVPITSCAPVAKSFDALKRAQKLHQEGFWNEAAAQCRLALEPFFEPITSSDPASPKRLKSTWESRVGKATYVWLNECMAAVKKATNKPHHETGSHFNQADALMLLTVTTALISYAARAESFE